MCIQKEQTQKVKAKIPEWQIRLEKTIKKLRADLNRICNFSNETAYSRGRNQVQKLKRKCVHRSSQHEPENNTLTNIKDEVKQKVTIEAVRLRVRV